MKKAIEKYKKFMFVFVIINLIALMVNMFAIESYSDIKSTDSPDVTRIHYFTNSTFENTYAYKGNYNEVWPFVAFEHQEVIYGFNLTTFNGIFYRYDMSEFLLYMGILGGFLVYKAYIDKPSAVKIKKI